MRRASFALLIPTMLLAVASAPVPAATETADSALVRARAEARQASQRLASGKSGALTYSMYASSMTTSVCSGTAATKRRSASALTHVPVGLFGFATNTSRVRSLMSFAMAARS